jgi:CMP-N,N'-diacetyllegionaminic acid synthase
MSPNPDAASKKEVLAVVMARRGSVGLPNKSLRHLLGKLVLTYTLDHVRESKLITRTVVSSDSAEILTLASSEGFDVINRPNELATATSATDPVLRHAVRTLYPSKDYPFAVVMLYGNIPLRANHMIDRAIQMLLDTNADSVQTIAPVGKFHPYWMFDYSSDGKIKKHIRNNIFRRQDLPPLYSPTGAVYVMKTGVLLDAENNRDDPHAFLGTDRRALIVAPEDSVDIDTEKDLYVAEAMLRVQALNTKD